MSLPGINRYSQAVREATERLNKLLLNDLSFNLGVFDERLDLEVGDIVAVTHPIGLSAKLMRVLGLSGEYGRYNLALVEYDPAVYDASVATAPTYTDTDLPNPASPPAVAGVTMTEEVFQLENGNWSSRWRITWSAAAYSFLAHYRAELWVGSTLIHAASPATAESANCTGATAPEPPATPAAGGRAGCADLGRGVPNCERSEKNVVTVSWPRPSTDAAACRSISSSRNPGTLPSKVAGSSWPPRRTPEITAPMLAP